MTQRNYYMGFLERLLDEGLITRTEFSNIEKRLQKRLGYMWRSYLRRSDLRGLG